MPAKVLATAALCALLLSGCFAGASSTAAPQGAKGATNGWHAVSGRAVTFPEGTPASIQSVGPHQLVLINFWASWCGPCKTEVPLLQRLSRRGKVRVLGVSRDLKTGYAVAALRKAEAEYPDVVDHDGSYMATFAGLIPMNAIPSSVLVRDGHAMAVHVGPFGGWKDLVHGAREFSDG